MGTSTKTTKKRKSSSKSLSLFDAVSAIDRQDAVADTKRRKLVVSEIQKANAVRSQSRIFQSLVETRILLQRAVVEASNDDSTSTTNQLQANDEDSDSDNNNNRNQDEKQAIKDGTSNSQDHANRLKIQTSCDVLLEKLLKARKQLTSGRSTTRDDDDDESSKSFYKSIIQRSSSEKKKNDKDENSDVDDNDSSDEGSNSDDDSTSSTNDMLHTTLQQEYEDCREEWKEVLNRRHNDLKLRSGGGGLLNSTAKSMSKMKNSTNNAFQVMDASFWQQVESVREYEDIRQKSMMVSPESPSSPSPSLPFDDSKVYQQLLKDFVSQSTKVGGSSSSAAFRTSSTKNSNSSKSGKSKMATVDRRASKGRKLRYNEIPKLVNFTFPLSRSDGGGAGTSSSLNTGGTMSFLNQDEYFQSLFGGSSHLVD